MGQGTLSFGIKVPIPILKLLTGVQKMNIKSLLIGSAALAVVSTGAQAADAIVVADPEPMEYVRICDVYGAGFFYIPGTETCLRIGGYYRYEIFYGLDVAGAITKRARFAPNFDVRSDTGIGTLRGYAELEIDWDWGTRAGIAAGAPAAVTGYGVDLALPWAHIDIIRPNGGTWRFGRAHSPYARFLGYGGPTINGGNYGFSNFSEVSYTFSGSNGFQFIGALLSNNSVATMVPSVNLGINFVRGWGNIGMIAGYDSVTGGIGAKAVTNFRFGNSGVSGELHVFYSSGAGTFAITNPAGAVSTLSVLAGLSAKFSPKATGNLTAQWFSVGGFLVEANVAFAPAPNFLVIPEIRYDTTNGIRGLIRLNRAFGS
jgi:hypothetical protein